MHIKPIQSQIICRKVVFGALMKVISWNIVYFSINVPRNPQNCSSDMKYFSFLDLDQFIFVLRLNLVTCILLNLSEESVNSPQSTTIISQYLSELFMKTQYHTLKLCIHCNHHFCSITHTFFILILKNAHKAYKVK